MGHWIGSIQGSSIMQVAIVLALAVAAAVAEPVQHHGHHAAHHAPELLCRDTNTSVYAEVCVPAFAEQVTPVTLAVKEVVDNDYCFDRVLTICEETNTVVQREICTYVYEREDVVTDCQTTQVTYDEKSETMKVTACGVQAPAYKVPLVTAPLTVQCSLAYPAPKEVCVTKDITITEVKCEDKVENKCFNVAKFVDATNTVDQKEIIIGEPSCEEVTLSLPTQSCTKSHGYHG